MDRGNLEPGHRMYADIAGMRPLLCKNVRRAVRGGPGHPYEQGFALKLWPERLELPIRWKKPRKIFVNSMSDWCHEDIPDAFVLRNILMAPIAHAVHKNLARLVP